MSATTGTIPTYTFPEHRAGDSFGGISIKLNTGTSQAPVYKDLTGADVLIEFRSSKRGSAVLTFTTEGDTPTLSITDGGETLNLLPRSGAVMNLPEGTYTADLDIDLDGLVRTWAEIVLPIVTDYSRRPTT